MKQASQERARRSLHASGPVLRRGSLPVGDGYSIFYVEFGAKDGLPAVFLHGGPGAGGTARMAQLFDPAKYRVVLFDQRGCGDSCRRSKDGSVTAQGQLEANTTWSMVEDMELLRKHLDIDRWVVGGGSWGSCLAVAYASRHADRVAGMVLRAACLFREEEMEFFIGPKKVSSARAVAPEAWKSLTSWLPWAEQATGREIAAAFRDAAKGQDAKLSPRDAMTRWTTWENKLFQETAPAELALADCVPTPLLEPSQKMRPKPERPWAGDSAFCSSQAMLTMHYVAERAFLEEDLLEAAKKFSFPLEIVHGRNDCICPKDNAVLLAASAPNARLHLTDGGHSQWDSQNIDAFVTATDTLAKELFVPA